MKCSFTDIYITAIRVDAVSMKPGNTKRHSAVEVNADSTSAIVDGLAEKNEYMLTVTTITEEYFDNLPEGELFKDCFYKIRTLALFIFTFLANTKMNLCNHRDPVKDRSITPSKTANYKKDRNFKFGM